MTDARSDFLARTGTIRGGIDRARLAELSARASWGDVFPATEVREHVQVRTTSEPKMYYRTVLHKHSPNSDGTTEMVPCSGCGKDVRVRRDSNNLPLCMRCRRGRVTVDSFD